MWRTKPERLRAKKNRKTKRANIRLIQLVDANDVKADGTLDYTAPYDRP